MRAFILSIGLLLGSIFFFWSATAVQAAVIISEIGAYESSGCEWLEIYNTGPERVNLEGWKFWENDTNHGLTVSPFNLQQGFELAVGEYAIITQNDQTLFAGSCGAYTPPAGPVFDSSWGTLNEGGEGIGLKDAALSLVEDFTYPSAPTFSLERVDPLQADYTSVNWREHAADNSFGRSNSSSSVVPTPPPEEPSSPSPPPAEEPPAVLSPPSVSAPEPRLVINEFVSDPERDQPEWVELYNISSFAVHLADWELRDGTSLLSKVTGDIPVNGFLVVGWTRSALNNGGDVITLTNASGQIKDRVAYGDWQDSEGTNVRSNAPAPAKGHALALSPDGTDNAFRETTEPTPGTPNKIIAPAAPGALSPPAPTPPPAVVPPPPMAADTPVSVSVISDPQLPLVLINELFPNPDGLDREGEYIELLNPTAGSIDLSSAQLDDEDGGSRPYVIPPGTTIQPGGHLIFSVAITTLSLNNDADRVRLLTPAGATIREVAYERAPDNAVFIRTPNGSWEWSDVPTPGKENIVAPIEEKISARITAEKEPSGTATVQIKLDLMTLQDQSKGSKVSLEGIVAVLPGVFGVQYFYVVSSDSRAGVQVYLHSKQFPTLALGDVVRVNGEISEAAGEKRVKLASAGGVTILGHGEMPEAEPVFFDDAAALAHGALVQVSGDVVEKKSSLLIVDDGSGEFEIIKKNLAPVSFDDIPVGATVRVTGLLSKTEEGVYRILPSATGDIIIETLAEDSEAVIAPASGVLPYLKASATGLASIILGFLARARGAVLLGSLRNVSQGIRTKMGRKKE